MVGLQNPEGDRSVREWHNPHFSIAIRSGLRQLQAQCSSVIYASILLFIFPYIIYILYHILYYVSLFCLLYIFIFFFFVSSFLSLYLSLPTIPTYRHLFFKNIYFFPSFIFLSSHPFLSVFSSQLSAFHSG